MSKIVINGNISNSQIISDSSNIILNQTNITYNYNDLKIALSKIIADIPKYNMIEKDRETLVSMVDNANTSITLNDAPKLKTILPKIKELLLNIGAGLVSSGAIEVISRFIG